MTLDEVKKLVDEQANNGMLWFDAEFATEQYLQDALRKLHEAVEACTQASMVPKMLKVIGHAKQMARCLDKLQELTGTQFEMTINGKKHHLNLTSEINDALAELEKT